MNALAQLIHRLQVLFPKVIQGQQHHLLFKTPHHGFTHLRRLGGVLLGELTQNAGFQPLPIKLVVFLQPLRYGLGTGELTAQGRFQARGIPLFFYRLRRDVLLYQLVDHFLAHGQDSLGDVFRRHELIALPVDHLPLVIGHVIVFEKVLPNIEVMPFHLALRPLNRFGHPAVLDGLPVLHT